MSSRSYLINYIKDLELMTEMKLINSVQRQRSQGMSFGEDDQERKGKENISLQYLLI